MHFAFRHACQHEILELRLGVWQNIPCVVLPRESDIAFILLLRFLLGVTWLHFLLVSNPKPFNLNPKP